MESIMNHFNFLPKWLAFLGRRLPLLLVLEAEQVESDSLSWSHLCLPRVFGGATPVLPRHVAGDEAV